MIGVDVVELLVEGAELARDRGAVVPRVRVLERRAHSKDAGGPLQWRRLDVADVRQLEGLAECEEDTTSTKIRGRVVRQ